MKDEFPDSKSDLFAAFIERCTTLATMYGFAGMITMQSWMFLSSYEKLRGSILSNQRITSMLHLGSRAFDSIGGEVVSSTAFVLSNVFKEKRIVSSRTPGNFVRLVEGASEIEKKLALSHALALKNEDSGYYLATATDFAAVPGTPIVYWLSEKMKSAFAEHIPLGSNYHAMNGMTTGENSKFLRLWYEVSAVRTCRTASSAAESISSGARWFPYNKGGEFRKWYGNQDFVINWEHDGRDVIENGRAFTRGRKFYFRPMVSWAKISSGQPSFRYYPRGFLFDVAGTALFGKTLKDLNEAVSLCNSNTAEVLLAALSPTLNFESGQISRLPLVTSTNSLEDLSNGVTELIESSKHDYDEFETSVDFSRNPLVELARMRSRIV